MAGLVQINWDPSARSLRQFGFVALGVFGLLAVCAWNEAVMPRAGMGGLRHALSGVLAGAGLLAGFLSVVAPRGNRWMYLGISLLSYPIGVVLAYLLMGCMFFGVLTPLAVITRWLGRDTLQRRFDKEAPSYWATRRRAGSRASTRGA